MLFSGKGNPSQPTNTIPELHPSHAACFSPSVEPSLRKAWVKNGGTLTHSAQDFREAGFFFCSGADDPWLNELLSRFLVVRHASWISKCVQEEFLMPIAPYTLDDDFDQARITDPASTPSPSPCEEAFALPTHLKDDLEALPDILDDMRTLSQSTPVNSPSLTPRPGSELEHQDAPVAETPLQTALKRSRSLTEDQDQDGSVYTKKPRIYTIENDHSDIEEITRTLVNPAFNDEPGRSLDKNSQLALAEHKHERWTAARPTPRHEAPPHKDARNHTPNKQKDKTPNLPSLLSKQPHPRPTCNSKRPRARTHPTLAEQTASRDRFARLIRPYNPAPRSSSPDACTNPAHSHSRPTAVTNININTAAAAALIPGLQLGLGSAAPVVLKLSIPAILRSTNMIRSTLFIANTTYRDQRFVCHAC